MITGFNTDIIYDGVTYHVQTEDKGLDSPLILSLVYSGGAILASKRSRYEDLIAEGFDEEALSQRLKRQHRLICAAINAGRLDDLKRMGGRAEATAESSVELSPAVVDETTSERIFETEAVEMESEIVSNAHDYAAMAEAAQSSTSATTDEDEIISSENDVAAGASIVSSDEPDIRSLLVDDTLDYAPMASATPPPKSLPQSEDEELPFSLAEHPVPAAYTVHDSRRQSPPADAQNIAQGMAITILDEQEFRAGQIYNVRVLVEQRAGTTGKPLGGVPLSVKILGTNFRPQLYTVKTGRDGVAVVSAQIPRFTSGRAAILIRADADGKSIETRRVIHAAL